MQSKITDQVHPEKLKLACFFINKKTSQF